MNSTYQIYKAEEGKFVLCYTDPILEDVVYTYLSPGTQIQTGKVHLLLFDNENLLADALDEIAQEPGWYMKEENRIPSGVNPNIE